MNAAIKSAKLKKPRSVKASAADDVGAGERLDHLLRMVEEDIVAGKMQPGERLDERTLAKRFGVSRTPVREVLFRMSSLGIVELRRNKGAFVARISSARLVGMLEVIAELKVLAARQAARRMSVEERQRIGILRDSLETSVQENDLQQYFDKANAMVDAIFEGTHNPFLVESARNIQVCLCAYRRHLSQILHKPIQTSLEENKNIADAIVRGDSAEAERWMRQQTELRREEFADLITLVSENASPAVTA
jgi:DNA-binding GntR family transcriptional regulator